MKEQMISPEQEEKPKRHFSLFRFKKPAKHMFWAWITYQVVKGSLTTTFIWIPLFYAWWYHTHIH